MVNASPGKTWEDIRKKIRDTVRHPAVRAWAMKVIDSVPTSNNANAAATATTSSLCTAMSYLFLNSSSAIQPIHLTFNS